MSTVDVVIPCYNYAHFLRQCVESVLVQGLDGVRVVIIDNASTDDSVAVARQLSREDPRVEVVCHEVNLGPHASFNEGVDLARADYFMILCADDVLAPAALARGIQVLDSQPDVALVLGADSEPWRGHDLPPLTAQPAGWDKMSGRDYIEWCCRVIGQGSGAHAMLVRASVQQATGHYRPALRHMDDLEMALRLACAGNVVRLHSALVLQRMHSTNQLSALWQDRLAELKERGDAFTSFFRREGAELDKESHLLRLTLNRIGEAAFWSGISHIYRRRRSAGINLIKYGARLNPRTMIVPPIGHLFRTRGALKRMATVISGTRS